MQKIYRCALAVALVALSASSSFAAPGELKLSISNGLVTIIADQVPVSRILSEWARVGETRIVNGEKLFTMVSLEVLDWPEKKALDLILRSASGYMAAERQTAATGASAFDRIMILPFSKGPVNTMPAAATPASFAPRPMPQQETEDDQGIMVATPVPQQQPQTQSLPGMPPQPQNVPGQPQQVPNPNAPTTLPRPGMLPQLGPQQPVPFGTPPGVPPKPPGGGGGGGSDPS
ncbi:MAG: hypothetical protein ABIS06_09315 [Vicinamibacterales bacterium]